MGYWCCLSVCLSVPHFSNVDAIMQAMPRRSQRTFRPFCPGTDTFHSAVFTVTTGCCKLNGRPMIYRRIARRNSPVGRRSALARANWIDGPGVATATRDVTHHHHSYTSSCDDIARWPAPRVRAVIELDAENRIWRRDCRYSCNGHWRRVEMCAVKSQNDNNTFNYRVGNEKVSCWF